MFPEGHASVHLKQARPVREDVGHAVHIVGEVKELRMRRAVYAGEHPGRHESEDEDRVVVVGVGRDGAAPAVEHG